ncbi:hypothetical protein ABT317_25360 [Streptomyces carpinensis]|uniref:DNA (cytosine-5-)-methyltransferase n=1 Tax=Streptomyces carpinensis TaxID=66369 RepID=A0ABV1W7N8_9ACTN
MDAGRRRLRCRLPPQTPLHGRLPRGAPVREPHATAPFPTTTFAECVGWPRGRTYLTRGHRPIDPATGRAKGGGTRSADLPGTCVTATIYGWACAETGERITQEDIGRLVGFPGDHPWRYVRRGKGIRKKAQQPADAVCPMVAAAVFGRILGITNWEAKTRTYVHHLYGLPAPVCPASAGSQWPTASPCAADDRPVAPDRST